MRVHSLGVLSTVVALGLSGCTGDEQRPEQSTFGSITTTVGPTSGADTTTATTGIGSTSIATTGADSATSGSNSSSSGPSTSGSPSGDDGPKFDVGTDQDINPPSGGQGCQKIDFLFVVDNSGSMSEEQQSLTNSFPGFISEIQNTVMADDYHIMVIDTDASAGGGCFIGTSGQADCNAWCTDCLAMGCTCQCNNAACPMPPTGECETELGGGKVSDPGGNDCGVTGGNRYMIDGQPNLSQTFACLATVGTGGDGNERPMEAMIRSVTDLDQMGECNEAFVRDDAILVVTFITDEEDNGKSQGNPTTWKNDLVTVKNGQETAIVMLGLIGDPDVQGGVCGVNGDAEASPNLRSFAESFTFGSWGSICSADYTPFFHDAVSVVDTACDEFEPPG